MSEVFCFKQQFSVFRSYFPLFAVSFLFSGDRVQSIDRRFRLLQNPSARKDDKKGCHYNRGYRLEDLLNVLV